MRRFTLTVFVLIVLMSGSARAAPLCITGTLAGYLSLGAEGCEIAGGTFSDFQTLLPITGAVAIAPSAIAINPVQVGNTIGLDFQINAIADSGLLLQALFGYTVMAESTVSTMVTVAGTSVTGAGLVTEIQDRCVGGSFLPGDVTGCTGTAGTILVLNNGSAQASFAPASQVSIVHDFTLDAGGGGTAAGGLLSDRLGQGMVPIPEPPTYLPVSAALLGISVSLRFWRRRAQEHSTGGQNEGV